MSHDVSRLHGVQLPRVIRGNYKKSDAERLRRRADPIVDVLLTNLFNYPILFLFQLRSEWNTVFWITFGIYAVGSLLYCLMLSGEAQHWAIDDDNDENDELLRSN